MNNTRHNLSVPSVLSFSDDTVKFEKSVTEYDCTRAYVPTPEVQNELKRISGKLDDCLYDDYRREIDTLKPNVEIDKELAALMTAEADIKQSRRNLRRRAQKMCPATGPTKEEECELKELNRNSIRKMYELEDFKRDFNTKPFVATEMVDMSLERIEDNIRKRQLALQNLRREIYEASVLRVTGYYMKDKVSKKSSKHASKIALQKYKHAFENALENSKNALETAMGKSKHPSKTAREKFKNSSQHTSRVYSESHAEEDDSYAKVKEIYRAERQRFKNNLEMFNGRLQEFLDSHQNIQKVERVSGKSKRKRHNGAKKVKPDIKTVKPDIKTTKPDVIRVRLNLNTVESDGKTAKPDVETDKPIEKTVKKKRPKESRQERRRREISEESEVTDAPHHDSQVVSKPQKDKKERRRKSKSRPTKEENQTSCDHERRMSLGGSDVEVTKEPVILPLPTLDPMPVYYDNFQASCALTHLFSIKDDFDEDFEADYVIPPYESERTVYTGKQQTVYSSLNKPTNGRKERR